MSSSFIKSTPVLWILTVFVLFPAPAFSQSAARPVHFMDLDFRLIETLGQTTGAAVIIPMAQIESHGLHLPVGTDYYCALEIAQKTAEISGAIVGVPLLVGNCVPYASWPGYVIVETETFMSLVKQYLKSMKEQGFKKIAFLIMHGGDNFNGIKLALDEYIRENPDVSAAVAIAPMLLSREEQKLLGPGVDIDTSIMLQVKPELVHLEALAKARMNNPPPQTKGFAQRYDKGANLAFYRPDNFIDASKSTAELGKRFLDIMSANLAEIVNGLK